ncbi:tellurite resistance/C4-dicarboxylate transporter family protein [Inhella gelatinilytica]|uniref:Tellurite resistance/C4-dicarboxylate transporter family protein n=1 Tax=Inhella gelatinilytica TaxID=2795030 RepID=A0A931IY07_9BURK|nr:tellurite resistance/C4-dicarboxylate transporter family protein [Inhella gelatinilytica]MBH9552083.1 tellurite resistance/C4-dicarboxylate transporter family protein [Inhella gelatinilytica]
MNTATERPSLRALHPGNFAFVMASGILALGFNGLGFGRLGAALGVIAVAAWAVLLGLSALRLARHAAAVKIDLLNPRMVFSYFTLVAATNIVGLLLHSQGQMQAAIACWVVAFLAWASLLYLAFSVLTILTHEHNVNIVHGGWLIAIVGTQSLVLLGSRIAPELGPLAGAMRVEVHMLWGLGLALYGIFVTLFCYRIFFLTLRPEDISPLLWVVMGAAAIAANAGTSLITDDTGIAFLTAQRPFIEGVTLMIWTWATWWIPMLAIFSLWKHGVRKLPLRYEPVLWSAVFPLGMYAVASARLGLAADFPPLHWIAQGVIWVAFLAWCGAGVGLLNRMRRALLG